MISTFYNTALHSSKSFFRKLPCPLEPYCTGLCTSRGNRQFKLEQAFFTKFHYIECETGNVSLIFNEWPRLPLPVASSWCGEWWEMWPMFVTRKPFVCQPTWDTASPEILSPNVPIINRASASDTNSAALTYFVFNFVSYFLTYCFWICPFPCYFRIIARTLWDNPSLCSLVLWCVNTGQGSGYRNTTNLNINISPGNP